MSELGFVPTGTQQQCSCSSHCWLTDAARYTISLLYTSLLLLCAAALPIAMVAAILWPRSNLSVGLVVATLLCLLLLLRKVVTKQPTAHVLTDPWLVWPREHRSVTITPGHAPFAEYTNRVRRRNKEKVIPSEWVDLGFDGFPNVAEHGRPNSLFLDNEFEDTDQQTSYARRISSLPSVVAAATSFEVERSDNPLRESLIHDVGTRGDDEGDVSLGHFGFEPEQPQIQASSADETNSQMSSRDCALVATQEAVEETLYRNCLRNSHALLQACDDHGRHSHNPCRAVLGWLLLWIICVTFLLWVLLSSEETTHFIGIQSLALPYLYH